MENICPMGFLKLSKGLTLNYKVEVNSEKYQINSQGRYKKLDGE